LIVVFDAWSAANISPFGYERQPTPNLARLAEKAIVYHQHYAGGHFTTPGAASLLTGLLPWEHPIFNLYQHLDEKFIQKNIFHPARLICYQPCCKLPGMRFLPGPGVKCYPHLSIHNPKMNLARSLPVQVKK
jgi:hypothetical protein